MKTQHRTLRGARVAAAARRAEGHRARIMRQSRPGRSIAYTVQTMLKRLCTTCSSGRCCPLAPARRVADFMHCISLATNSAPQNAAVRFAILSAPDSGSTRGTEYDLGELHEKARTKAIARNAFAHFQPNIYPYAKTKDDKIKLSPHIFDFRYEAGLAKRKEYTLNDMRNHARAFAKLAKELRAFVADIPLLRERGD